MALRAEEHVQDGGHADILDAAARCFTERGYAATSIDDVARRLGATKGRIYHHYPSKADLFAQVCRTAMDMNYAAIEPVRGKPLPPVGLWTAMATVHVTQMIATRHFQRAVWEGVELMLRGATTPHQRQILGELLQYRTDYGNLFRAVIARGRQEGVFAFDDLGIANQLSLMTLNSPIFWYSPRPGETARDRNRIVRQVVTCALRGLGGTETLQE